MIAPGRIALLALALAFPAAPGWGQGVTPRTVVLGQSAPLSGPLQSVGEEVRNGALAYLRKLNDAGGVHGRRLELATLDDGGDPARALANTRRFVEEFRVFALFGYPEPSLTRDVLARAHQARVPLVGALSRAAQARQPGRMAFAVAAGRRDEADRVVGHYAQLGLRRFALVRSVDEAGTEYRAAVRDALSSRGLGPAVDVPFEVGPGHSTDAARQAFVSNPEVVLIALPQPPAADLVREIRRGDGGAQLVVLSAADPARLASALGAAGAGVALSQVVPPLAQLSLPVVAEYRAAFEAAGPGRVLSPASLEAYVAAKVLAEAVRRAGPVLSRDSLLRTLEAMSHYDSGGHVVAFSRTRRQGSSRNYLLLIGSDGGLLH